MACSRRFSPNRQRLAIVGVAVEPASVRMLVSCRPGFQEPYA
jgi:hypothetical protein